MKTKNDELADHLPEVYPPEIVSNAWIPARIVPIGAIASSHVISVPTHAGVWDR